MSLPVDHWNNVYKEQAAKSKEYKGLKALRAIHSRSVLLLNSPSDQPWLGEASVFSRKNLEEFSGSRNRCHQNVSAMDHGARRHSCRVRLSCSLFAVARGLVSTLMGLGLFEEKAAGS